MKKIIIIIIKIIAKFIPLQDAIMFESKSDFCDNSRALFDYMISQELNKKYKMVWLVEEPEKFKKINIDNVKFIKWKPSTFIQKIEYVYYLSSSKWIFFSHIAPSFKLNRGETFVNLWHGTGLKNINFCDMGFNFDYILYSSSFYQKAYIEKLNCKKEQLLPLGNPRTDLLFKNIVVLNMLQKKKYKKTIVWMPTYRVHKSGFANYGDNISHFGLPIFSSKNEFNIINDILKENNISLIIKLHPAQDLSIVKIDKLSNINILTNEDLDKKNVQLYSLLGESDALITDYSSVYVDYLLTTKPIAFTIDDMADYKSGYIFENPLDYMPGKHILNFDDFKEFILDVANNNDEYFGEREKLNKVLNDNRDGDISDKIVEYFGL